MNRISTHILDTARGRPAAHVPVKLERQEATGLWHLLTAVLTDSEGRCAQLLPPDHPLPSGCYRLRFDTANYYSSQRIEGLYPVVEITFQVRNGESHYHIPLLLSANGYTTYRGS
ncbi:MAG TPA: hydroxyisourate hydrolase [Candidatus Sulfotelmatobacter sp.]